MTIDTLIEEMKALKAANPTLEITDVLRIFHIQATIEQTQEMRRGNLNG